MMRQATPEPVPQRSSFSARAHSCSEDVRIVPVVIPELKLGDIERQVLGADLVEGADHAALNEAPEAFDGLGVDCAHHVLALAVVNGGVREFLVQELVADPLVRAEQAHLVRYRLPDEGAQRFSPRIGNHAGDHVALTLNGASNDFLADAAVPWLTLRLPTWRFLDLPPTKV